MPDRRLSLESLAALTHDVAGVLAGYRTALEAGGMSAPEAWALTQRLEERLLGPLFDAASPLPGLFPGPCPSCHRPDAVIDVGGSDGAAWLCLHGDCGHHWRDVPSER